MTDFDAEVAIKERATFTLMGPVDVQLSDLGDGGLVFTKVQEGGDVTELSMTLDQLNMAYAAMAIKYGSASAPSEAQETSAALDI